MINFYDVNDSSGRLHPNARLGKLLRLPLRIIPQGAVVPILQGPGRGLKWIVGSYNHGCWLGSYEFEKQIIVREIVRPGDVVYDIGAHVGYFSIIFAKLVGVTGAVYAFEPIQENYDFILRHVTLNKLSNVTPICAGVAAESGTTCFARSDHSAKCHRSELGSIRRPVYNLNEYVSEHHLRPPHLIKMDIEGEEMYVVPAILDFIVRHRTKLLVSTHDNGSAAVLSELLAAKRFTVRPLQWASHPMNRSTSNATLLLAHL